ncbi:MAG: hypothetical protein ACPKOI_04910 [Pleomorphochaeta sp.]
MKLRKKKLFIVPLVIITLLYLMLELFYITRAPIYFVSDSIYYQTTIRYQKSKLKYNALLNNRRVKYVVDEFNNGEWVDYDYKENATIILSPYISMLMSFDDNIKFENNTLIKIDDSVKIDYLSGYEKLAKALEKENKTVFLIYSLNWPSSSTKANVFEKAFNNDNLNIIELKGNELEQRAFDIVEKLNKMENVEVVSTGSSLISYFNKVDNNIIYNFEAYQALSVPLNSVHYIIYEDLTPLVKSDIKPDLVLETKLQDNQVGLVNFFLHLYRSLLPKFF